MTHTDTRVDLLRVCVAASPKRAALIAADRVIDYWELDRLVERQSRQLADAGIRYGDRVVLIAPNSWEWIVAAHACLRIGAIVCPLDPTMSEPEVCDRVALLEPSRLLTTQLLVERWEGISQVPTTAIDSDVSGPDIGAVSSQGEASTDPNRIAAILMTSGTSGAPKGIVLRLRHLVAAARSHLEHLRVDHDSRWLINLPLHHIGGFVVLFRALLSCSGMIVHTRFDADDTLSAITNAYASHLSFVPTTLRRLLDRGSDSHRFNHVRAALIGGSPAPIELLREARRAGLPVCPTYGMTETCSQLATLPPVEPIDALGQSAPLLPAVEVEIRNDDGQVLQNGHEGEIWIRGPMVAEECWEGKDRLVPLLRQGWLSTADIGVLYEGKRLRVLGRRDDVIISGGEKVHPLEVEQAIMSIPGIMRAAVVGEKDPEWGQRIVAIIQSLTPKSRDWLRDRLHGRIAPFKIPKRVVVLTEWPEQSLGKVRRSDFLTLLGDK